MPCVSNGKGGHATDPDIARARHGDEDAFERLASHRLAVLYRVATAMVGPEDGRDAVQEALVTAWRDLPALRQPDRFDAWLKTILMNRCRNVLRSQRRARTVSYDSMEPGSVGPSDNPVVALHARWEIDALLASVPERERAVLALHYLADLPMRQVADILGMKEGTAKTRLHAGLQRLRTQRTEAVS